MRPNTLQNATKVLIAAFAVILSLTGFAEARDLSGDRHQTRRHYERSASDRGQFHRQRRPRTETQSGVTAGHWYRDRRHHDRRGFTLSGRVDRRQYYERHYGRHLRPDRSPDRSIVVRQYRGPRGDGYGTSYGNDGFPDDANGGTYFGGLSAWTDPGNGTYFSSERNGYGYYPGDADSGYAPSRPKIIHVNPSTAGRSCSWESGVCVIRR